MLLAKKMLFYYEYINYSLFESDTEATKMLAVKLNPDV